MQLDNTRSQRNSLAENFSKVFLAVVLCVGMASMGAAGEFPNEDWVFSGHSDSPGAVAVDKEGYVYSGGDDVTLRKIDPSGNGVWSFGNYGTNTYGIEDIEVDSSGVVYSAAGNSVKKIDSSGNQIWSFNGHTDTVYGIEVDSEGNVYTASRDNSVKKIDSSGNEVWTFNGHTADTYGVQGIGLDDSEDYIYTVAADDSLKKIDPSGNEVWSVSNPGRDIAVGGGYIYTANPVKKIDSSGNEVWSSSIGGSIKDLAVDSADNVYKADFDGVLNKINSEGNKEDSFSVSTSFFSVGISPVFDGNKQYISGGASTGYNSGDHFVYRWTNEYNRPPSIDSRSVSPDPPLIGEPFDASYQASDSDGTVSSVDVEVFDGSGSLLNSSSRSYSSSSVSDTVNSIYTPQSEGDINTKFTVTDDAGAETVEWINRTLTDTAPSIQISSPGNNTYWDYNRTLEYSLGSGDSVPGEDNSCTASLDGQQFDSATVTDGETYSTDFSAGLGLHTVQVECTDPNGHTNSSTVDFTTKAFELQSVSGSSSVYESENTSYTADFQIGSMVENVSTDLNWDGQVRNSEMYSNGGSVENISTTHYFRPPVVQSDGVSKDWFIDYSVDYLDVNGQGQTGTGTSTTESQSVNYAFYNPQISLSRDRAVESGEFDASNAWTEELSVSPAETSSTISFNGSTYSTESKRLEAPIVSQNQTTKTVSGDLTVEYKNQSRTMQSSSSSIDVYKKILTDCSAGLDSAETLLFALYNEQNRSSTMTGDIVYNLDVTLNGDHTRNYAFDKTGVENATTCIYPSWAEYKVTGPIQYSSSSSQNVFGQQFPDRQYNLYNQTLNSNLRDIDLYLLSDQYSTPVYFEVLNQAGEGVSDATVSVRRYFIGENSYLTVAKSQTDSEGVATTYMRVNEIYYKYTVTKNGEVLLDTDREILTCQSSPCTKTLRVNEQDDNPYFVQREGFSYNVTNLTNDQGNITGVQATVSHDSDVFNDASLKVERRGSVSTETVCDLESSSNPTTMVCDLDEPAGDDYITYVLKASTDGYTYTLDTGVISEPSNIFGDTAYFAAFALFLMFSMIGMASPKIGIIFSTAGILVPWMLGFYALSLAAVGSLVAVALALVVTNNS